MNVNLSPGAINRKGIVNKLLCGCKIVDDFITQFYSGMTMSFDMIIKDVEMSAILKKIFHAKQILFYVFHLSNFMFIYSNFNIEYNSDNEEVINNPGIVMIKKRSYYIFLTVCSLILFFILLLKLRPIEEMYLSRNEEMEKFILSKNNELINNQCQVCKVTRCMRSVHCQLCNRCVTKYEMHSDWFHICIGSINCFLYTVIILLLNVYFLITLFLIGLQIFYFEKESVFYDLSRKEFLFHSWFIVSIYLCIKMLRFTYDFIYMGLVKNLTDYEGYNWRRLPYLWGSMRKDYFNPFDKGWIANLKEVWLSFLNPSIKLREKISLRLNANENLTGRSNISSNNEIPDDIMILDLKDSDNQSEGEMKNLEKATEPFTPSDNSVIYRQFNGDKNDIINWTKIRLYTVFDLKNSPFREVVMKMQQQQQMR